MTSNLKHCGLGTYLVEFLLFKDSIEVEEHKISVLASSLKIYHVHMQRISI